MLLNTSFTPIDNSITRRYLGLSWLCFVLSEYQIARSSVTLLDIWIAYMSLQKGLYCWAYRCWLGTVEPIPDIGKDIWYVTEVSLWLYTGLMMPIKTTHIYKCRLMSSCQGNNVEYTVSLGLLAVEEDTDNEIVGNPIRTIQMPFTQGGSHEPARCVIERGGFHITLQSLTISISNKEYYT